MSIKQKSENKIKQMNIDIFLNQTFLDSIDYVLVYKNENNKAKNIKYSKIAFIRRHNQNYNVIINGKNFYDQEIDSDIKRYEEIRKLITQQGEDYTTGCLQIMII